MPGPKRKSNMNKLPRDKLLQPQVKEGSRFVIIGLGGVGSIVARYAACFLASQPQSSTLKLVDGDNFEPGNATRMIFGDFGNKAAVVRQELLPRFIHSRLVIGEVRQYVTPRNIRKMIGEGNIVLLCVDNHRTRRLVDRHCQKLRNICLISGGNDGVGKDSSGRVRRGTYGNVQIYVRQRGRDITPCLSAYHPEIKHPQDKLPTDKSCTELVVSTPQILFSNLAVASAMLNTLLLYLSNAMHYGELSFDIADGLCRPTVGVK